jgi:amino acid permease
MDEEVAISESTRKVIIIALQILMFPLYIQRTLTGLNMVSIFGVLGIAYVVVLICG